MVSVGRHDASSPAEGVFGLRSVGFMQEACFITDGGHLYSVVHFLNV